MTWAPEITPAGMYGGGSHYEAEQEEFLKQQQQQQQQPGGSQYNFNYYDPSGIPAAPSSVTPEYPTVAPTSGLASGQYNPFSHSASTGSVGPAPSAARSAGMSAFDNIDISKNNQKFSGGTPFETVHEFVSVSNKVRL